MASRFGNAKRALFATVTGDSLGDLGLALGVVAVVTTLVIPLPAALLDLLIALDIALSLVLLLVALFVAEPVRLAALPSMLLLATLFRLALNVSTTRLVLLHGSAGAIVEAFGRVVVGGNVVVGAVVFAVLSLVQFVVVAKGAERVAEVAARFTLDALPGKQMSIDADMRNGALDFEEAQRRRALLERESQLYGALDGAMKFVKGDAIAGLAIVAINIVGGLAIGVLQRGMSVAEAASHYTILTVGDGLSAQIPSLLVSTTAGLVVTRVPGDGRHLGVDVARQVFTNPTALGVTGAVLALLALAPGMPLVPFVALGAAAGIAAARLRDVAPQRPERGASREAAGPLVLRNAIPVRVAIGVDGARALDAVSPALAVRLDAMRERLLARLGVRAPAIEVATAEALPPTAVEIAVGASVWASELLPPSERWCEASEEELRQLGVEARVRRSRFVGVHAILDGEAAGVVETAGLAARDRCDYVVALVERVLAANAAEFVGVQETRDLVDALEATHPALVAEVVPRALSLAQVAEVLRRLVAEEVAICDLRAIFEALAATSAHERDPLSLVEAVRCRLWRQLTHAATCGAESLPVYLLSLDVEAALVDAAQLAEPGGPLPVDPSIVRALVGALGEAERLTRDRAAARPVVVVPREIRRHTRALVETAFPAVPVFSFQELAPSLSLRPVATLG